jgi:hypothetical protein
VSWEKSRGKWTAKYKQQNLGYFATEEAAARAYNDFVEEGVDNVKRRDPRGLCITSHLKGVT